MAVLVGSKQLARVQGDDAQGHVIEAMFSVPQGDDNVATDARHTRYPRPGAGRRGSDGRTTLGSRVHHMTDIHAITLRTRSGQEFVIRSKNKKGEPYRVKKEDTETPVVMQVIRPALHPNWPDQPASPPTATSQRSMHDSWEH